jgi:hypothetical protein
MEEDWCSKQTSACSRRGAGLAGLPAPSTALNATDTIWQFFAQNHH